MAQVKNEFDAETKRKIRSSFKWALTPAVVAGIIDLSTKAPVNRWWGVLVIYVVPILVNALKEYVTGTEK